MRYLSILTLFVYTVFLGIFPVVQAATDRVVNPTQDYTTSSGTVSDSGTTLVASSLELADSIKTSMNTWYRKNNMLVSFLPELPPVHKIDAIAILLGVFLVFWSILRFLSK